MKQATPYQRRKWLEWHFSLGTSVAATCRYFGISRSTFYRWLARYDPARPETLKARSRRPRTKRQPRWSVYHLAVLSNLAAHKPRWGQGRLRVALAARGWQTSEATVGRMLAAINRRCPICQGRKGEHNVFRHDLWERAAVDGLENLPLRPPPEVGHQRTSRRARAQAAIWEVEDIINRGG